MHTACMVRCTNLCFWVLLMGMACLAGTAVAGQDSSKKDNPNAPGEWLQLPKDGRPWKHPGSDLMFPARLGDFTLSAGFQDKRTSDGVALTYSNTANNLKADIVIYPCGPELVEVKDVQGLTHVQIERLADDLLTLAKERGYSQKQRSAVADQPVPLWEKGLIPMSSMTLDMVPSESSNEASLPSINQWLALLIYQDHFIQLSVVMQSAEVPKLRKQADELITLVLHCIRYPALTPELIKLCERYAADPLSDDARKAADSLLAMSKESPVFEVAFPGEALTPSLDEVNARAPDAALDLLRGFVAGSGMVTLKNGTVDESLEEGARLMLVTRKALRDKGQPVNSIFLDDLAKAQEAGRAASFLKERMNGAPKKR